MMKQLQRLYKLVTLPLRKHFHFFLTLFVLHALVDMVYFYIYWRYSLTVCLHGLFMAYLLTAIATLCERLNGVARIYKGVVLAAYIFSFFGDVLSHSILDSSLDEDVAATILATNKDEFIECVQTYFSVWPLLIGITALLILYKLYTYLKRVQVPYVGIWLLGTVLGGIVTFTNNPLHYGGVLGKAIIFYRAQSPIHIGTTPSTAQLLVRQHLQPKNVVMIIGESLNKLHCTTYGYDKPTTPRLQSLADHSSLLVFTDVISPEVHTLPVFKTLFSKYRCEWGDSIKWYEQPTLQEILRQSGYTTYWVSNQSKHGVCDNFIGNYAELCTENYFVGNKLAGMKRKTYDGEVLELLSPLTSASSTPSFYVVHLMGSHFKFSKRYPAEFQKFTSDDYPSLPSHQREVVATYDNSVLYNDWVVSEIIRQFEDKEAIVFYFSDHAIDLFQSSPSYYGHAKKTKESFPFGQLIPFYVYMSPSYQAHFPEIVRILRTRTNQSFCTDNMFYTVMDLIGTTFKDSDEVANYSLIAD